MKLSTDAKIITVDGKGVGNLSRFVLDPRTKKVSHIVFEHGLINKVEYLVPIYLFDYADESGIHLKPVEQNAPDGPLPADSIASADAAEPDELVGFKRFLNEDYVIADEQALMDRGYISDERVDSYYYYPSTPFGAAGIVRPLDMYARNEFNGGISASQIPVSGDNDPIIKQTSENIPPQSVAVKEGAKVVSSDYKHVGNVEKVFIEPKSGKATHMLVTKGLLLKAHKLIPAEWVSEMTDDDVYLTVDHGLLDRLPEYKE